MRKRTLLRLAVVLTALSVLLTLGALWWWALLDMTVEVGGAVMGTVSLTSVGAVVAWGMWSETADESGRSTSE